MVAGGASALRSLNIPWTCCCTLCVAPVLPLFAAARLSSADAYTKQEITSPRVGQLGARTRQPCVATMVQAKQRTFATRDYHVPVGQTARTCTLPHNSARPKSSLVTTCGLLIGCLGPLVDDLEGDAISVRVTQRTNADSRNIDRGYAATQRVALTCTTQDPHNPGCANFDRTRAAWWRYVPSAPVFSFAAAPAGLSTKRPGRTMQYGTPQRRRCPSPSRFLSIIPRRMLFSMRRSGCRLH
jgi:hypothetical protein